MQDKFNSSLIKAAIGLGNPGKEYENTYHNAGFLFVDYLKEKKSVNSDFKFLISKTDTHMNESGKTVVKMLRMKNLKPEDTLIIHDDSDVPIGSYKFSFGRSAAGHKGVESVVKNLKTKNFWRLRIGIRPIREKSRQKAGDFVLKKIKAADKKILEKVFFNAATELISGENS